MPAIVPTHSPEGVEELRRGTEKGLPTEAGGWCSNPGTTGGENAAYGSLGDMGAGCKLTHAPGTTGTSTSTTNDINPALSAGYGCSNEEDCMADVRDRQKPAEAKLKPSMTNKKFQSPLSRPNMSCGRKGQSEKRPYVTDTGSVRSDLRYSAVDYRGQQKRWLQYYPPQEEVTIPWKLTTTWNQHVLPEERKPCMPQQEYSPAGAGRFEPTRHGSQAPEIPLP